MSDERLSSLLKAGGQARVEALRELAAGKKRGHWIWFLFPTLAARAGDMFSSMQMNGAGADLASIEEATRYAAHPALRKNLLEAFAAVEKAMGAHTKQAPYQVLDSGFRRQADGQWIQGPVDSFKLFCCATLFAVLAHQKDDDELRLSALSVLRHFKGDVVYTAGAHGSSGNIKGTATSVRTVLQDHDAETVALIGGTRWEDVSRSSEKHEL